MRRQQKIKHWERKKQQTLKGQAEEAEPGKTTEGNSYRGTGELEC